MRMTAILTLALVLLWVPGAAAEEAASESLAKPESLKERASYAFGVNLVSVAKHNAIELDPAYFVQGVQDALAEQPLLMSEDEIRTAIEQQQQAAVAKHEAWKSAIGLKNKQEGDAFLAANKDREGIHVTPDGLQYKILKEGTGPVPKETDTVIVHYTAKLLGGPEFETTKGGEPKALPVDGIIAGWKEALTLMPVGSHWKVWVPPGLAYGEEGGHGIGPHATLAFEIELLKIQ